MCLGDNSRARLPENICHLRHFSFLREIRWPREKVQKYLVNLVLFPVDTELGDVPRQQIKAHNSRVATELNNLDKNTTSEIYFFAPCLLVLPFLPSQSFCKRLSWKKGVDPIQTRGTTTKSKLFPSMQEIQDLSHLSSILRNATCLRGRKKK